MRFAFSRAWQPRGFTIALHEIINNDVDLHNTQQKYLFLTVVGEKDGDYMHCLKCKANEIKHKT